MLRQSAVVHLGVELVNHLFPLKSIGEGHNQVPLQATFVGCPAIAKEYHLSNFRLSSLPSDVANQYTTPRTVVSCFRRSKGHKQVPIHAIIIQAVRRLACASDKDFSGLSIAQ